jgi:hypothetical protein
MQLHIGRTRLAIAMLAATVGAVAANAQPAPQTPANVAKAASTKDSDKATPKAAPAPPAGGMVVFIDPATGQIRQPEAAEIGTLSPPPQNGVINAAPSAAQQRMPDVHREFRGAGGMIGVKLGDDSLSYMVVSKTPDGKLAEDCVTGGEAAAAAVSKGVTPKTPAAPAKPKVVLDDK